jgi:hypothetical protein
MFSGIHLDRLSGTSGVHSLAQTRVRRSRLLTRAPVGFEHPNLWSSIRTLEKDYNHFCVGRVRLSEKVHL